MTSQELVKEEFLKKENCESFTNSFSKASPFPHLIIDNFFDEKYMQTLAKDLLEEEYYLEDHDLYQFMRTADLKYSKNESIANFHSYLQSNKFISHIENITKLPLSREQMDLHSLLLSDTNYLLCHDDKVEGRAIAFIIYLSKEWDPKDGGILQLFSSENEEPKEVVKEIFPLFNRFVFFKVTDTSFHQVSEVLKDKGRLSLSGWFYHE